MLLAELTSRWSHLAGGRQSDGAIGSSLAGTLRSMPGGPREKDTCRDYVLPRLKAAGWGEDQIVEQFPITDGRIVTVGKKHRRAEALRADYVLEYQPGVPIAVVEAKREYAIPGKGLQQARNYAQLLDLPFAYSTNGHGIVEDDRDTGLETDRLTAFPSPDVLWSRYRVWKGIVADSVAEGLLLPFNRSLRNADGTVKEPRYYQRTAINRSVQAILRGDKRLLLTMATGTGKTFVSMQVVWKLWKSGWRHGRNPRVLYLADRNILIDQPIDREFRPAFGTGDNTPIWTLRGEAKPGREIYFALYQALADSGEDPSGIFRGFAPDFFDLVIVDECHRGSARAESSWRAILDYFSPATQLGMTATPKRDETADSYEYFGDPLYEYSLAQGIDDGFLAPTGSAGSCSALMPPGGRRLRVSSTGSAERYRTGCTRRRTSSEWCRYLTAPTRRPSTSLSTCAAPTGGLRRSCSVSTRSTPTRCAGRCTTRTPT